MLVEGQANPNLVMANPRGRVPLTLAMNTGRIDLAKLLVKHGADPDWRDYHKQTVWEVCRQHRTICTALRKFIEAVCCFLLRWHFPPCFSGSDSCP